ncbi:MAG: RagB/SusD family nutrient uptake outer membrane protein [Bacteroidales bacterium]|nr:RagB/SusD family nutrient uptake outer membrane protein [Bacteroidales bacterium]
MKNFINKISIISGFCSALLLIGCSDFLDRQPLSSFSDDNFWTSESNVEAYAWSLYNEFYGYGRGSSTYGEFYWQYEGDNSNMLYTDNLLNNSFITFPQNVSPKNSKWKEYYEYIRKANLMITRIPNVPMSDIAKTNWTGVGKFFRAKIYFDLLAAFGDVPYINKYMNPGDPDIYVNRTDRSAVVDSIISDLDYAAANITQTGDDEITSDCALALKARVALFEGTYEKYHKSGTKYEAYLAEAYDAAKKIMDKGKYSLGSSYKAKYNSYSLADNPEMIFHKRYEKDIMCHSLQNYTHTSTVINGLTKAAVESYDCTDGLPISQSPLYKGDHGIASVLADRDPRLSATIYNELGYKGSPIMEACPGLSAGTLTSTTGYVISMFDNGDESSYVTTGGENYIDAPIYTYSEILLDYAESKAELGTITQNDLDISVNLLRKRAGIADLKISGNNVTANEIIINDPQRTSTLESTTIGGIVSPLIWEIRRERRAELMTWAMLRYQDLMRWGKGEYLDTGKNPDVALGAWVDPSSSNLQVTLTPQGYIDYYPSNTRTFTSPKDYLNSIPNNDIILYAAEGVTLENNPGWE